jgi:hypothetical protein
MLTLLQYDLLMPQGVRYVVVGCLSSLLLEIQYDPAENREILLSKAGNKFNTCIRIYLGINSLIMDLSCF